MVIKHVRGTPLTTCAGALRGLEHSVGAHDTSIFSLMTKNLSYIWYHNKNLVDFKL